MSIETYARWMCLIEAIDFADKFANRRNINLDNTSSWIKPLDFKKYMDERYHAMLHDVKVEEGLAIESFTYLPAFNEKFTDSDHDSESLESLDLLDLTQ